MTIPTTLMGRYRLLQPLDEAQTAWRAMDELLHRDVMVRRIADEELPAVRAATALRHSSAVIVHDVVTEDGGAWAVTEPVEAFETGGVLSEEQATELGLELLDALTTAHALGVVHGGVQPSSVVRSSDGRVKLLGFGMSRPYGAYLPPEAERTPASDLWGLAATLSTLLEGRSPYPTAEAIRYGQVLPPMRAPRLGAVLLPLLNPDPTARPGASGLRRELKACLPKRRKAGEPWRFRPLVLGLMAAALAVVLVPVTISLVKPDPPQGATRDFTSLPDPCTLLTGEQVEQLVVTPKEGQPGEQGVCTWSSDAGLPSALRFDLRVEVELSDDPRGRLDGERNTIGLLASADSVPGLGEEAFLKKEAFQSSRGSGFTRMTVAFRMGDAVGIVEVRRSSKSDEAGEERVKNAALRGAYWVAEAMHRG
ncbi:protein kinase family protein [Actinocorallia populi]|uniref:hypothetical protein n=1 Tax=Actinocorallia populi TaxID=2079200 RepID=UPI00130058AD|nr:hypothetical protein [Actinocorallia populi]